MLEIKDEIKDAQKLFEVRSDIISTITNKILQLSSMGRKIEAARFEKELNKLMEVGEVSELNELLLSVNKSVEMYK